MPMAIYQPLLWSLEVGCKTVVTQNLVKVLATDSVFSYIYPLSKVTK